MAKSARASCRKTARSKLRATVYDPVERARINRLSEKLLAVAASKKPATITSTMDIDQEANQQSAVPIPEEKDRGPMHIDSANGPGKSVRHRTASKGGNVKRRQGKSKYSLVFPGVKKSGLRKRK